MARYDLKNKVTGEEFVEYIPIKDIDQYLIDHPDIEQVFKPLAIVSGIEGHNKPDQAFRDLLREQKKFYSNPKFNPENRDCKINTFD